MNTCETCQHYDPSGNLAGATCQLYRPQHVWWNAAERQVIQPIYSICQTEKAQAANGPAASRQELPA
jgi:hypothetical protein